VVFPHTFHGAVSRRGLNESDARKPRSKGVVAILKSSLFPNPYGSRGYLSGGIEKPVIFISFGMVFAID